MNVKIGVLSYDKLTEEINKLLPYVPSNIDVILKDGSFDKAIENVKIMEKLGDVDAFISAGANSEHIKKIVNLPYVEIEITGMDLLFSIKKASKYTNKIGIITFKKRIPYLSDVKKVIKAEIVERTYENEKNLEDIFNELTKLGIQCVIGSSLIYEYSLNYGFVPIFIYSKDGILKAINHASAIANTRNIEIEKTKKTQIILEYIREGIIVTDDKGNIEEFNRRAESILGIEKKNVIGRNVKNIIENTRLDRVINREENELNQIQIINDKRILTNRVPIILDNNVIGALATFSPISEIKDAERSIRKNLVEKGFAASYEFEDIIGNSDEILKVIDKARIYSNTDSTILIEGESGTGKELFAQSIHNNSFRYNNPFVAVNCAAIPKNLLESELFGYVEGAFTGARKGGKTGVFELANNGTVFLDEIGEIPMEIQSMLLRAIEEKEIFRIGDEKITPLNVRIIAATNKKLYNLVEQGIFRRDLYYRINVLELEIPPLRERNNDVKLLLKYFIIKKAKKIESKEIEEIVNNDIFKNYHWPGNIRELSNIAERIIVLYENYRDINKVLNLIDLPVILDISEKEKILNALNLSKGNREKAAKLLRISRTTLWRKMKEYNIV